MHIDGRHLEFQNGDLFSRKACWAGYHFAMNFSLKLVEVCILTIEHLQLSEITCRWSYYPRWRQDDARVDFMPIHLYTETIK